MSGVMDTDAALAPLLDGVEALLEVTFEDRRLLREALTHTSYRNEHGSVDADNQRLEFLGDSVLGCVIAHLLCEHFAEEPEGMLTRYRALLVSEEGLAAVARELNLGPFMLLGRGEELTGGSNKASLLADLYEALIGAVYLDRGFEMARTIIQRHFAARIAQIPRHSQQSDFKTQLQELSQRRFQAVPTYRIVEERGPDHEKTFHAEVSITGVSCATGVGRTKKDAEQEAARQVWEVLSRGDDEPLPRGVPGGTADQ
ncbi:MAG: ribonuclease 3 [Myxococcales bacterium]